MNEITGQDRLILTAAPDFIYLAGDELGRVDPGAQILATLAPGVILVNTNDLFLDLAQRWQKQPPIFVRHICPAQTAVLLVGDGRDLAKLRRAVWRDFLDRIEPSLPFSVQTRLLTAAPYKPFDVNSDLAEAIHTRPARRWTSADQSRYCRSS